MSMNNSHSMSGSSSMSAILNCSTGATGGDAFQSTNGNNITLGKHKRFTGDQSLKQYKSTLVFHDDGPSTLEHNQQHFTGGLSETRFHKGFQRRSESNIHNPLMDQEKQYRTLSSQRSLDALEVRKQGLTKVASSAQYDIISGKKQVKMERPEKPMGLRMNGDGLGGEAPKRGSAILRESQGRYFAPYPSGQNQEHRQDVLLREGVSKSKMSSIIQIGQSDLPSYGVEDQFAKSDYRQRPKLIGLFEMTKPGAFPPAKQPFNPSGNPKTVKGWAKGVTISNLRM